jgi:inorganic pyrophosphatase
MTPIARLPSFALETGDLNVIIETPRGCRNKYSYDEQLGIFKLGGLLPAGAVFPFDFGFIPQTVGGDGDPLDVLVLMDERAFPGCLVQCRLLGVIEANQTEKGKINRNDRLIAVVSNAPTHQGIKSVKDLEKNLIQEIEHFFISYNQAKGKKFKPRGCYGPQRATRLIKEGQRKYRKPE